MCPQVDNVINRMGLRGVADSRVGGAVVRGVSGGEKRRVTIALQLLKDPGNSVLVCCNLSVLSRSCSKSQVTVSSSGALTMNRA